jgi:hypothetical protein
MRVLMAFRECAGKRVAMRFQSSSLVGKPFLTPSHSSCQLQLILNAHHPLYSRRSCYPCYAWKPRGAPLHLPQACQDQAKAVGNVFPSSYIVSHSEHLCITRTRISQARNARPNVICCCIYGRWCRCITLELPLPYPTS